MHNQHQNIKASFTSLLIFINLIRSNRGKKIKTKQWGRKTRFRRIIHFSRTKKKRRFVSCPPWRIARNKGQLSRVNPPFAFHESHARTVLLSFTVNANDPEYRRMGEKSLEYLTASTRGNFSSFPRDGPPKPTRGGEEMTYLEQRVQFKY